MIVPLVDTKTATIVYVNPAYVVSLRPDPEDPDHVSNVRLRDGEEIRAKGAPEELVGKLLRP